MSSILNIVIAASVANLIYFSLLINGSKIPYSRLFLIFPSTKSNPVYLNYLFLSSSFYAIKCAFFNLLINSEASFAALVAKTLGIIVKASANADTASYSLPE